MDVILSKLKLHLENPNFKESSEDRVKFKLDFIINNIKLSNTVTELQKVVEEVKKMSVSDESVDVVSNSMYEVKHTLVACRSVAEIEAKEMYGLVVLR